MNTLSEFFKIFTSQTIGNTWLVIRTENTSNASTHWRHHIRCVGRCHTRHDIAISWMTMHDVNDREKWPRCYQENDHNAVALHALLMTTLYQRPVITVLLSLHVPRSQWVALLESRCVARTHLTSGHRSPWALFPSLSSATAFLATLPHFMFS